MNFKSFARRLACATTLAFASFASQAQFVSGELLTAAALNAALASPTITSGTITGLTAPLAVTLGGTGASTLVGLIAPVDLAAQAANTVLANVTGSNASPTAFAMPSCSTSSSALQYTSGTGFNCSTSVNAATLLGGTWNSPGNIGTTSPGSGSFTTLAASGTVSGTGFSTYLASPPAIGGTTPAAGAFTTLSATGAVSGAGFTNLFASPPAIGGTAAAAGSFTTLSASSTVSGTGFSNYLASPPAIGGTTAAAGKFTTLQATSTITPSSTAGIVGTTTNDNANAGSDGEFICAQVTSGGSPSACATNSSTPVSLTTGTAANVTSISLTPGDWDVRGAVFTIPNAATTISVVSGWISTISATLPSTASQLVSWEFFALPFTTGQGTALPLAPARISVASTTTVYLSAYSAFGTNTMSAAGWIAARRVR
ncbi:hypothetical protein QFZ96_004371 [Paraburkholderia youngii]